MISKYERASKGRCEQQTGMLTCPIRARPELVGKRFITAIAEERGEQNQSLDSYCWKQGYIRACSLKDINNKELQVLVEFDGLTWEYRKWIRVYEETKAFYIENTIVKAIRVWRGNNGCPTTKSWPALIFSPLVDYLGYDKDSKYPVEYFGDKQLAFFKQNDVELFEDNDENLNQALHANALVHDDLLAWQRLQKVQSCLMNGMKTLTGARVTVYRLELRQWYTGCITAHNLTSRELHVMDDSVLQTHVVHPALVQISLMANDDELHQILQGEQVTKMLPTRSQRNAPSYLSSNNTGDKMQGLTNYHTMIRDMSSTQPKPVWNRPSVVQAVTCGKSNSFSSSIEEDLPSNPEAFQSLYNQSSNPYKEQAVVKTSDSQSSKVKVHKPIPVYTKHLKSISHPSYTSPSSRMSTPPLLSSLTSSPSPVRAEVSPLSTHHTPSPQSLKSQASPRNSKTQSPINILPFDQRELIPGKSHENYPTNYTPHTMPMMSPRKSNVVETTLNSKLSSQSISSPAAVVYESSRITEAGNSAKVTCGILTPEKTSPPSFTPVITTRDASDGNSARNFSPRSDSLPTKLTDGTRFFVPGVNAHRKKTSPPTGKAIPPTAVVGDFPTPSTTESSSTAKFRHSTNNLQDAFISPQRCHAYDGTNEAAKHACHVENGITQNTDSIKTQSETSSRGTQYSNTPECSHLLTVAKIQLEYLILLEALVRFQHRTIIEAINTINQTVTEDQFFFVADFFCKLVEGNRNTENLFRQASVTRQERQRAEHQRHLSQSSGISPNRVVGGLSDEIKARLRTAQEDVNRKREEVLRVVLPFEGQQSDWETMKQHAQKKFTNENVQKQPSSVEDRSRQARQGTSQPQQEQQQYHYHQQQHQRRQQQQQQQNEQRQQPKQKQSDSLTLQPQQRRQQQQLHSLQDKSNHETSNHVEPGKERQKIEEQGQKARGREEAESKNRIQVHSNSSLFQTTAQHGNNVFHATRTPQTLQQLRPLPQYGQLYEQRERYDEQVQKKMVDELLEQKDMQQKTILLEHIVQALESQKYSRNVETSPPVMTSNISNMSTERQLLRVQNKSFPSAASTEVNEARSQQAPLSVPMPSFLSAETLLSSLSTAPATAQIFGENPGTVRAQMSGKQPPAKETQSSNNWMCEKPNSELAAESLSTSGTATVRDGRHVAAQCDAGIDRDNQESAKARPVNKCSSKKRKTHSVDTDEGSSTLPKPKRQRKSTKKKNVCDVTGKQVASSTSIDGQLSKQEKLSVKSVPPVLPFSSEPFLDPSQYQPRSITKGIGFAPIRSPNKKVNGTVATASARESLDMLASVSVSISGQKPVVTSVIPSAASTNRSTDSSTDHSGNRENRRTSEDLSTTTVDIRSVYKKGQLSDNSRNSDQQVVEPNHDGPNKSTLVEQVGSEVVPIIAHAPGDPQFVIQSVTEENAGDVDSQRVKDQTAPTSNQAVYIPNLLAPSRMIRQKAAGMSCANFNGSVSRLEKPRNERQKKDLSKKIRASDCSKIQLPNNRKIKGSDSLILNSIDTLPGGCSSTVADKSLVYLICGGQKNYNSVTQTSASRDTEKKNKGTAAKANSLSHEVRKDDTTVAAIETAKLTEISNRAVSAISGNDGPTKSVRMVTQERTRPVNPTFAFITQDIQPLNLGHNKTLLHFKSHNNTTALKGKQKSKSSVKDSANDSHSKSNEVQEKKFPETKHKRPRCKKHENRRASKSSKKSSVNEPAKVLSKGSNDKKSIKIISDSGVGGLFERVVTQLASGGEEMLGSTNREESATYLAGGMEFKNEKSKKEGFEKPPLITEACGRWYDNLTDINVFDAVLNDRQAVPRKEENISIASNEARERNVNEVPAKQKYKRGLCKIKKQTVDTDKKKTTNKNKITKDNKKAGKVSLEQPVDIVTNSLTPELPSTDGVVKRTGLEQRRNSEDIVFVNDQSVTRFVEAVEERDRMLSENKFPEKRKRCTSPLGADNNVIEPRVPGSEVTCSENKQTQKMKSSENCPQSGEKKETKARRKKSKKEIETKNESIVAMDTGTLALPADVSKQDELTDVWMDARKKAQKTKKPKIAKEDWVYFLQQGSCKTLPSMSQCRECRIYESEEEAVNNKSCCRFDMFRRCRSKSTKLEMAGFSSSQHTQNEDFLPWIADTKISKLLSLDVSKYILLNVGEEFCNLVKQEEEAFSWETKKDTIAWKRAVRGIREMCDACATTIFNVHWVCPKCGFGVCLDCYKTKMNVSTTTPAEAGRAKRFLWVRCSTNNYHRPQRLVLTHIIPKKTLHEISEQLHEAQKFWGMERKCSCKQKELEGNDKIQEHHDDEQDIDDNGDNSSSVQQDEAEVPKSVEPNSETPMETASSKIPEAGNEVNLPVGDTNSNLVQTNLEMPMETASSKIPEAGNEVNLPVGDANSKLVQTNSEMPMKTESSKIPEAGNEVNLPVGDTNSKLVQTNLEMPMETESSKIPEAGNKVNLPVGDTNSKLVQTEVRNSTENILFDRMSENISPESEVKPTLEFTGGRQYEEKKCTDQECHSEKSFQENMPANVDSCQPASQDKLPISHNKQLENEVEYVATAPSKTCEEFTDDDTDGLALGALSLIKEYGSPIPCPTKEPECEDVVDSAEKAILSRLSSTQGESSEIDRPSPETVGTISVGNTISSHNDRKSSETLDEPSVVTNQSSVFNDKITDKSPVINDETSVMTDNNSLLNSKASEMIDATLDDSYTREVSRDDNVANVEATISENISAPHSWICRRPMLRLHAADHVGNLLAFQGRWLKGEPVLVSGVHKNMTSHLWTPEGFENEFGSELADVVNCKTGGTLEKMNIGTFWRGFESVKDRPLDNKGDPTLLKLKDWPPEADFVEKMPTRFKDLMDALPLPEYTRRNGSRNLVSRLPDFFVKPDLGPKMYNAYGNAAFPSAGTTNLHIDMSDAVNVMVYVGVPFDQDYGEQERKDSLSCISVACDETQQSRAQDRTEKLGALWHIFAAEDANKIRALFHKVCREKNMKYPASHDPIHDQCFYLDEPLLKRLKDEYGVVGWPIAQFLGDAIFIPAGAPHQVRNLHSCVKAAEDFVSPEHVGHCFKLTEEFRHLSEKHTNHEDKLQVKNIIYHAVKDALCVLRQHELTSQNTEQSGNENVEFAQM